MDNKKDINKIHFTTLFGLIISLLVIGSGGYMIIEKWGFLDSLYMVVITLATVGYKKSIL